MARDILAEHTKIATSIITTHGGKLLGIWRIYKYGQNITNCSIMCEYGHTWETFIDRFKLGRWCHYCANRIDPRIVQRFLADKDGILLKDEVVDNVRYITVKCNKDGHVWKNSLSNIRSKDQWCQECYIRNKSMDTEGVRKLIAGRGELLTTNIYGVYQKVDIRCNCGNPFSTYIYNLIRDLWCPACSEKHTTQLKLYELIKSLLPTQEVLYNQHPFNWLKDARLLEIDIWVPGLKLAIEYDGEQHFRPVKFGGDKTNDEQAQEKLAYIQSHDHLKDTLIAQHPQDVKHFIRFKYDEPITNEYIRHRLEQDGLCL